MAVYGKTNQRNKMFSFAFVLFICQKTYNPTERGQSTICHPSTKSNLKSSIRVRDYKARFATDLPNWARLLGGKRCSGAEEISSRSGCW